MEQRNNLVLQGTETFSRGQLDNVALDGGALVLDSVAGRCLQYGSYTTPEFAMPAFCNLNVSWNAFAPHNTMVEVRCRVYAGGNWTGWMSFGKWAPGYPRCSCNSQSDDGMIFLMGDTVTVATPGGGTGVQLQVNLSTNDDKVSPAVRLLAAAVRPLAWEKHNGHPLNRQLYLPEYCLSAHDPSFGSLKTILKNCVLCPVHLKNSKAALHTQDGFCLVFPSSMGDQTCRLLLVAASEPSAASNS